jgi:hypothetical protein
LDEPPGVHTHDAKSRITEKSPAGENGGDVTITVSAVVTMGEFRIVLLTTLGKR